MLQLEKVLDFHTFSITARDRETGAFGVAVATARPNVGSLVPWVSPRGAIATQARINTDLGRQGLALMAQGVPVDVALSALLRKDSDRELRQVHGLDGERAFCHTGGSCVPWCGHEQGDVFTVAGNMLAGPDVIAAMSRAFRVPDHERRDLSDRLLLALAAGPQAGCSSTSTGRLKQPSGPRSLNAATPAGDRPLGAPLPTRRSICWTPICSRCLWGSPANCTSEARA